MTVRSVPASAVRPLRAEVLRPGRTPESLVYPGDDAPLAFHAGGFIGDEIHGIATVYPEPPPEAHRGDISEEAYGTSATFRLRGMATSDIARSTGLGREVLLACFEHIRASGGRFLWCNARIGALGFYERMGWTAVGEEFDMPGIGGHYVMWIDLG
ncbi:GNAT family N-acetyltransferase [Rubricoccus marinus]|uniref:N-acetyltransferase domain-containing protein n=1 Tax=Rubricoccus marinus TaxID=716817 RepID=A0A259TZ91_9BACT|nr:GNAT family N-acetyltransferase [Rubricoccus marinus]OZC02917.1 hypothetical protein BSZ36_07990 [Rubricoccus marinus]